MKLPTDPAANLATLIRCASVTPAEGGALTALEGMLKPLGFSVERPVFSEDGTPDIENLYARRSGNGPHLMFAGHTDVVPVGDEASWTHPPFAAEIAKGEMYGRGAVDMKGGIACFVAAGLDHLDANGGKPKKGSLSFLITGDEEGVAINGTVKLLKWAAARGESFEHCIVGEPSSLEVLGDTIKAGRRGSLSGTLVVAGRQGHVAYPERTDNPIRGIAALIAALQGPLDEGSEHFDPSNLEFTSVDVGNRTGNLIPAEARARFNIRYNDRHSATALKALVERGAQAAAGGRVRYSFDWQPSNADVFLTKPGPFTELAAAAAAEVTGHRPKLSTTGGTSDARFIKDYCPVLELGLVGQTAHHVDEFTPLKDLVALTAIYRRIIERYFA